MRIRRVIVDHFHAYALGSDLLRGLPCACCQHRIDGQPLVCADCGAFFCSGCVAPAAEPNRTTTTKGAA